ncbi:MAG: GIY-YIG nuclease family protein [Verrucomicrobia bacterium]|jgi:hypothetical protein|nr:GIY-YIG nuclease family protein [Verrucomicrobiota bacterium]
MGVQNPPLGTEQIKEGHSTGLTMTDLSYYMATEKQRGFVESQFTLITPVLDFSNTRQDYLSNVPDSKGIYLICGQLAEGADDTILRVYVGKTTNLQNRIKDYHRSFQVYCPNDRKLAFFQAWLQKYSKDWKLALYILRCAPKDLSAAETKWIKTLDPLVNATNRADTRERRAANKSRVEKVFQTHFTSFFQARVKSQC